MSLPKGLYWQAQLYLNNNPNCGATIIDEETVLTATFCVIRSFSKPTELFDETLLEIEAGVVTLGDATGQIRGISKIIVHPCFRRAEVTIDRYVLYLNYYLSYDVCACFRPCVRLSEWVSFCKKKIFVQNGWNLQIRWTDISNSRIQARRAWSLVLYKGQILLISVFKSSLISYVPLFL